MDEGPITEEGRKKSVAIFWKGERRFSSSLSSEGWKPEHSFSRRGASGCSLKRKGGEEHQLRCREKERKSPLPGEEPLLSLKNIKKEYEAGGAHGPEREKVSGKETSANHSEGEKPWKRRALQQNGPSTEENCGRDLDT